MASALIIVDVQNDFLPPNGSLAVPDGDQVIPKINEIIKSGHNGRDWDLIVATRDWHPKGHITFASSHKGHAIFDKIEITNSSGKKVDQVLWPDHCIQNTWGSELSSQLLTDRVDLIVDKGFNQHSECYSPFFNCFGDKHTDLEDRLRSKGVKNVSVVGLAFDFCVLNTAIDSAKLGFSVTVLRQGTRSVNSQDDHETLAKLARSGVAVID